MRAIEAYQTSDGQIYTSEDNAQSHQFDLVGESLDGLFSTDRAHSIRRIDKQIMLLEMLASPSIKDLITTLDVHLRSTDIEQLNKEALKQLKYITNT